MLQVEVEEALDKVITTLKLFECFRSAFREFRGKLPTYFPEGKKPRTWEFQVGNELCIMWSLELGAKTIQLNGLKIVDNNKVARFYGQNTILKNRWLVGATAYG